MSKTKLLVISIAGACIIAVVLGFSLFSGRVEEDVLTQPAAVEKASTGLGIIYLPVNRGLSEYYELGVDNGALVTQVVPGSPAERAGVQAGDVILSFNGARLEPKAQLLGMMMSCPAGDKVTLEVWRVNSTVTVEFWHIEK